jgi:Tfp pilus assembly pilus retraction ATPase PilT
MCAASTCRRWNTSKCTRLIYDIMNDKQRKDFEEFWETDFSFEVPGVARFRVNAFNQNRGAGAVFEPFLPKY